MRAVNLLPREAKRSGAFGPQNLPALLGAAVGLFVVAVLAAGFLFQSSKVASARHALDRAKQELAATPLPPSTSKAAASVPAVVATEQPLLQAVSSALSQRIAWDRILRRFSLVLPADVWLSSLTLTTPVAATAGTNPTAATGLQVAGTTYSYDSVARLLSRLALVPDLTGVTLANSTRSGRLVQFTVTAGVKGAPAPAIAPTTTTTETTTTPGGSQ